MKQLTVILVGMSSRADWQQGILTKTGKKMQAGVVNRNFHVLQTLLKRPEVVRVISVDFLPFSLRKSVKQLWQSQLWRTTSSTQARGMTWRLDRVTSKWWSLAALRAPDVAQLKKFVVKGSGLVIWSYHPFFPEVFQLLEPAIKIFDTVDNWAEHPVYANYAELLQNNYSLIDQTADFIFTVSPDLRLVFPTNSHISWIPNGVDVRHFSEPNQSPQFNSLAQPFVVYCGVIQERFDINLMVETAKLLPHIKFVIAGPVWEGIDLTPLRRPNIQLLGPVNYEQLPSLLARASCGIIPHRVNRFTASMNPLKLYEYLAAGLPVVSTPIKGTEQFPGGVMVASTPVEFAAAIQKSLSYTHQQKQQLRDLVTDQTWDIRVEQMLSHLNL